MWTDFLYAKKINVRIVYMICNACENKKYKIESKSHFVVNFDGILKICSYIVEKIRKVSKTDQCTFFVCYACSVI